jgi:hypothetical protein
MSVAGEWPPVRTARKEVESVSEYGSLREKIAAEKEERAREHEVWAGVVERAHAAGLAAAEAAVPTPMVVGSPKNLMGSLLGGDDGGFDPDKPTYYVSEGACGFGWVSMWPERSGETRRFVNWMSGRTKTKFPPVVKCDKSSHWSYGKFYVWAGVGGQSVARKEAYVHAFAEVLRDEVGLKCYGSSRLD